MIIKYAMIGALLLVSVMLLGGIASHLPISFISRRGDNGIAIRGSRYLFFIGMLSFCGFSAGALLALSDGYTPALILFVFIALISVLSCYAYFARAIFYRSEDDTVTVRSLFLQKREYSFGDITAVTFWGKIATVFFDSDKAVIDMSCGEGERFVRLALAGYKSLYGEEPPEKGVKNRIFPYLENPFSSFIVLAAVLICLIAIRIPISELEASIEPDDILMERAVFVEYTETEGVLQLKGKDDTDERVWILQGFRRSVSDPDALLSCIDSGVPLIVEYVNLRGSRWESYNVIVSLGDGMGNRYLARSAWEEHAVTISDTLLSALNVLTLIWVAYAALFLWIARYAYKLPRASVVITLGAVNVGR
ncbi:MAG: hypothetical protein IJY04_04980 [Clostridia bacterium]|nr:hypothetical protein [Clostridia bacterium]